MLLRSDFRAVMDELSRVSEVDDMRTLNDVVFLVPCTKAGMVPVPTLTSEDEVAADTVVGS